VVSWRVSVLDRASRAAIRTGLRAPTPLLVTLTGGRVRRDGLLLDPQLAVALAMARRAGVPSLETMDVPAARAHVARVFGLFDVEPQPMESVTDTAAPGPTGPVPIRIYRPPHTGDGLVVYIHGGGGVVGSLEGADALARLIAAQVRCQVASVDYRLAPEHPHPAAVDDAEAAWRHLAERAPALGVSPARMVLAGDSMGGLMCAHVERRVRPGPRPALMVLIYPATDLTMSQPSHTTFSDGFVLTAPLIRWFRDHYCPSEHRAASPLFFDDLEGAAPTLIITAGFDPLRDEGRLYADRLRRAGAAVEYRCHDDLVHGFVQMTGAIDAARAATGRLVRDIRAALYPDEVVA